MNKLKKTIIAILLINISIISLVGMDFLMMRADAQTPEIEPLGDDMEIIEETPSYLKAMIRINEAVEVQKSNIFDASGSFIPQSDKQVNYVWEFGDGNKNEGPEAIEVLHAYKEPGKYTVSLTINDGLNSSKISVDIFAYRKLILLITDQTEAEERIEIFQEYAKEKGVFINLIESFGSSTEFISEEVLTNKLTEEANILQKADQIAIWTKENAGMNALSRYIQNDQKQKINLNQKSIVVLENDLRDYASRIQNQFQLISPKSIILAKEGAIYVLIESIDDIEFTERLEKEGYEFLAINEKTGKLRPWNFMSYFVNILINKGIPDNTIALLLLLPVIATVIVIMKQVVGLTTFGIYTPSVMTLSFLIIGVHAGLLTLFAAMLAGAITRPVLKKVRMLFIPKMAVVIIIVSFVLLLLLIGSTYLNLFDAQFLSIAIFPMLILSTLVEKLISVKSEKGLSTALILMGETVFVAIIAYFIVGGEINLGFATIQLSIIKRIMITYPEILILFLFFNILIGKWSGLRVFERIRFREIFRHIEE